MTALKNRKNIKKKYRFLSYRNFSFLLFSFLLIAGATNLAICNNLAIKGFKIRDLRQELNILSEENRYLESELITIKSYDNLKFKIDELRLVNIDNVKHLSLKELTMAKR